MPYIYYFFQATVKSKVHLTQTSYCTVLHTAAEIDATSTTHVEGTVNCTTTHR